MPQQGFWLVRNIKPIQPHDIPEKRRTFLLFPGEKAGMRASVQRNFTSLPNNFHQHALAAVAVEFTVENLFPRAEIQFPFRDGHHDFAAHDLAFHVRVGIVFTGAVVLVL